MELCKERRAWRDMLILATNPRPHQVKSYGPNGVGVCESWKSFDNFLASVGPAPAANSWFVRIDKAKGYEPGNVKWGQPPPSPSARTCKSLPSGGPFPATADMFSASAVREATGATLRQLQWWDEKGIERACRGGGRIRYYSASQVRLIQIAVVLLNGAKVGPRRAFETAKLLDHHLVICSKNITI